MQLGRYMRELWGQKLGLAIALALATLAAARVFFGIGLFPPSFERNPLDVASASTQVIVDTPRSATIDLRQDTYSFTGLTNRALLLGNVMASLPVREYIARRAGVPANEIRVTPPLTPEQPRVITDGAHQPKTADILRSPDEYRLNIQANPTVPILSIFTEAPSANSAGELANAAVDGLRDYLDVLARERSTPRRELVKLSQLGRATGGVINPRAGGQVALLTFLVVFVASCAAVLFIARVRRGWVASGRVDVSPARNPS